MTRCKVQSLFSGGLTFRVCRVSDSFDEDARQHASLPQRSRLQRRNDFGRCRDAAEARLTVSMTEWIPRGHERGAEDNPLVRSG